ncbi:p5 [Heliothis armigera cypovirus 5]|uniref:p5 n=1 Tax=Heliothis armigera cypovirus 5 TaxID=332585 RepID=B2X7Q7_9REOV|nr:p5 [Cypovirus 5]ABV04397.1 p5 [Heliothis armigera cypovirus 5]
MSMLQVNFRDTKKQETKHVKIYTAVEKQAYDKLSKQIVEKGAELEKHSSLKLAPKSLVVNINENSVVKLINATNNVTYFSMRGEKIDPDAVVKAHDLGVPILCRSGVSQKMFLEDKRYKYESQHEIEGNFIDELTIAINNKVGGEIKEETQKVRVMKDDLKTAAWILDNNVKVFIRSSRNDKLSDLNVKPSDIGMMREFKAVGDNFVDSDEGIVFTYAIYSNDFDDLVRPNDVSKAAANLISNLTEPDRIKRRRVYLVVDGKSTNNVCVKKFINIVVSELDAEVIEYTIDTSNRVTYKMVNICKMSESELEDEMNAEGMIFRGTRAQLKTELKDDLKMAMRGGDLNNNENAIKLLNYANSKVDTDETEVVTISAIKQGKDRVNIQESRLSVVPEVKIIKGSNLTAKKGAIVMFMRKSINNDIFLKTESQSSNTQLLFPETYLLYTKCETLQDTDNIIISKAKKDNVNMGGGVRRKDSGETEFDVIGIEPIYVEDRKEEMRERNLLNEIRKFTAAFKSTKERVINTGNIGCEFHGGNAYVKLIQQIIAATLAGKNLDYYVETEEMREDFTKVVDKINAKRLDVRELYTLLVANKPNSTRDFLEESDSIVVENTVVIEEEEVSADEIVEEVAEQEEHEGTLLREETLIDVDNTVTEKESDEHDEMVRMDNRTEFNKLENSKIKVEEGVKDTTIIEKTVETKTLMDIYESNTRMLLTTCEKHMESLSEVKTDEELLTWRNKGSAYVEFVQNVHKCMGILIDMKKTIDNAEINKKEIEDEQDLSGVIDSKFTRQVFSSLIEGQMNFMHKKEWDAKPILMVTGKKYADFEELSIEGLRYGITKDKKFNVFESTTLTATLNKVTNEEERIKLKKGIELEIDAVAKDFGYVTTKDDDEYIAIKRF